MIPASVTSAALAVQKAERRHEYAITALMMARNAGRPTAHLEAELLLARAEWVAAEVESARSEWVLAEVAGQQLLARRIEARS